MSRTRTVVLSALGAAALVAAISWGASATTASGRTAAPSGNPAAVEDSVLAAALGLTDDASAAPDGSPDGTPGHLGMGLRPGMGGPGFGMGGLLHGEGVVKDRNGDYVTVATQAGAVTSVTTSSVTVTSDDGYARTWALSGETKYWAFPDQASKSDLKT